MHILTSEYFVSKKTMYFTKMLSDFQNSFISRLSSVSDSVTN